MVARRCVNLPLELMSLSCCLVSPDQKQSTRRSHRSSLLNGAVLQSSTCTSRLETVLLANANFPSQLQKSTPNRCGPLVNPVFSLPVYPCVISQFTNKTTPQQIHSPRYENYHSSVFTRNEGRTRMHF